MFYVYGLIDSSTGECFYVGEGIKRSNVHSCAESKAR